MRLPDYLSTTAFRQSLTIAGFFSASSLIVFALIYWQTVTYASQEVDHEIVQTAHAIANARPYYVGRRLDRWLDEEIKVERYGILLDANGNKVAGNMERVPDGTTFDDRAQTLHTKGLDQNPEHEDEIVRGVASRLSDGRQLVVAVDTDEWEYFRNVVFRALALGLIPTLALSCLGGALFGRQALRRVNALDLAIQRITQQDLSERLPRVSGGRPDEFDRLARSVNLMLDDLQRLLLEVQAVGDSIAHDLRTPLTRMRARLDNAEAQARTPEDFKIIVAEAKEWLDQTLGVITAVLRIGEIEHGNRKAAFRTFPAADLVREVYELMEPLADEKGLSFEAHVNLKGLAVTGDRELMLEALVNLVDNAIKFTPAGGSCSISLLGSDGGVLLRVQDSGPGIPKAEREAVLRRFWKSSTHRHSDGNGLGLALVAAVTRLHDFDLTIADASPGCVMEIRVPPEDVLRQPEGRRGALVAG